MQGYERKVERIKYQQRKAEQAARSAQVCSLSLSLSLTPPPSLSACLRVRESVYYVY